MREKIPVMFRVARKRIRNGDLDVYALFPTLPGTDDPRTCTCYQYVGQHSSADIAGCIRDSRPAELAECVDLMRELKGIYDDCELVWVARESRKMQLARYEALRNPGEHRL